MGWPGQAQLTRRHPVIGAEQGRLGFGKGCDESKRPAQDFSGGAQHLYDAKTTTTNPIKSQI